MALITFAAFGRLIIDVFLAPSFGGGVCPMTINDGNFEPNVSPYERPNFPYRCGRAVLWGKPCVGGPNANGSCGGVSECQPYNNDGRWLCRRPAEAGGSCADGPLPDGSCCNTHTACQPRPTLRKMRERITLFVAAITIAAIAVFGFYSTDKEQLSSSLDAGPLTNVHKNFTAKTGCVGCHDAYDKGGEEWIDAALHGSGPSGKCVDCHQFKGSAKTAHNLPLALAAKSVHDSPMNGTTCTMCHTEHKGETANITTITDAQCQTCHQKKFNSFADDHPEFPKTFPFRRRTAIAFNHTRHFSKHFKDQRYTEKVPAEGCISCHDIDKASRIVPVKSFDQNCAQCHQDNVSSRPMVLFTFPELGKKSFDEKAIKEKNGLAGEAREEMVERLEELTTALKDAEDTSPALRTALAAELNVAPLQGVRAGKKAALQALTGFLVLQVSELSKTQMSADKRVIVAKLTSSVTAISDEAVQAQSQLSEDRFEKLNEQLEALGELLEEAENVIDAGPSAESLKEVASSLELVTAQVEELDVDEDFEPESSETLPPVMAGLLGVEDDDEDAYRKPIVDLVEGILSDGTNALNKLIANAGGNPEQMLWGLPSELATSAATAWASNREYEPKSEPVKTGWYADEFSLIYRAAGHNDPVMKAWLTFAADKNNEVLRSALLSRKDGAGACAKCHAVSKNSSGKLGVEWPPFTHPVRPLVRYLHKPHIDLLGPGSNCTTCHKINEKADFESAYKHHDPLKFVSNFESIGKATCSECHNKGQVRQTCQTCHTYHQEPGFKKGMVSKNKK
jgi:hypothetical protein